MTDFYVQRFLADGAVFIQRVEHGRSDTALWASGKIRGRAKKCAADGAPMEVSAEAYRPVGNQQYRAERICVRHVQAGIDALPPEEP